MAQLPQGQIDPAGCATVAGTALLLSSGGVRLDVGGREALYEDAGAAGIRGGKGEVPPGSIYALPHHGNDVKGHPEAGS